jgi:hypothetical protein
MAGPCGNEARSERGPKTSWITRGGGSSEPSWLEEMLLIWCAPLASTKSMSDHDGAK